MTAHYLLFINFLIILWCLWFCSLSYINGIAFWIFIFIYLSSYACIHNIADISLDYSNQLFCQILIAVLVEQTIHINVPHICQTYFMASSFAYLIRDAWSRDSRLLCFLEAALDKCPMAESVVVWKIDEELRCGAASFCPTCANVSLTNANALGVVRSEHNAQRANRICRLVWRCSIWSLILGGGWQM